ncbi:hypothetical protein Tcan_13213 [Toxocara canis]|nr:hypothetical protein Tcan_13213 [Toxocara canis]
MLSALAIVLICSNWLAFAIGVVSNILVTVLCFMVHNEEIRVFRWGFAMVSIVELAECFVLTALQIGLEHMDGTTAVLLMGFVAYFPKVVVMIFYLAFLALFVLRTLSLPISFVYRYAIICG